MKCLNCGADSGFKYFCDIKCEVEHCDTLNAESVAKEEPGIVNR